MIARQCDRAKRLEQMLLKVQCEDRVEGVSFKRDRIRIHFLAQACKEIAISPHLAILHQVGNRFRCIQNQSPSIISVYVLANPNILKSSALIISDLRGFLVNLHSKPLELGDSSLR